MKTKITEQEAWLLVVVVILMAFSSFEGYQLSVAFENQRLLSEQLDASIMQNHQAAVKIHEGHKP